MTEVFDYEDARGGGIEDFADVLRPDRSRPEIGDELIPSPEGAERYAEFLGTMVPVYRVPEEDDDLLAAA